jgi:hypothetical protein
MGRSTPNLIIPECAYQTHDPDGSIVGTLDLIKPSTIRAVMKVYKKRSLRCWNHQEFKMEFKDSNGIVKNS